MGEPWYEHCVKEIELKAAQYPRRMSEWERNFFADVKPKILRGQFLNPGAEKKLLELHGKMTEPTRLKR